MRSPPSYLTIIYVFGNLILVLSKLHYFLPYTFNFIFSARGNLEMGKSNASAALMQISMATTGFVPIGEIDITLPIVMGTI